MAQEVQTKETKITAILEEKDKVEDKKEVKVIKDSAASVVMNLLEAPLQRSGNAKARSIILYFLRQPRPYVNDDVARIALNVLKQRTDVYINEACNDVLNAYLNQKMEGLPAEYQVNK